MGCRQSVEMLNGKLNRRHGGERRAKASVVRLESDIVMTGACLYCTSYLSSPQATIISHYGLVTVSVDVGDL